MKCSANDFACQQADRCNKLERERAGNITDDKMKLNHGSMEHARQILPLKRHWVLSFSVLCKQYCHKRKVSEHAIEIEVFVNSNG